MARYLGVRIREQMGDVYDTFVKQMEQKSNHHPLETARAQGIYADDSLAFQYPFVLPRFLQSRHQAFDWIWNATPRHAFADLHTDEGAAVFGLPVGGRKI
jgi:hypothetical protein